MNANGIPSELLRSTPRQVRLAAGGYALAALAVVLLAGAVGSAVGLTALARQGAARRAQALREGVPADAEVTGLGRVREGKRKVHFRYHAGGRTFVGATEVRRREWQGLEPGSQVEIRYLRSDPEHSWMAGHGPEGVPFFVPPLVAGSCVVGAAAIGYAVRRQKWLLEMGRPALATVTEVKGGKDGYAVKYEFMALNGARRSGSYNYRKKLEPGTTTVILYDPDNPRRAVKYPLTLWKPD